VASVADVFTPELPNGLFSLRSWSPPSPCRRLLALELRMRGLRHALRASADIAPCAGTGHRQIGAHGAPPTLTMIRLTRSATGSTATAIPPGTHSLPPAIASGSEIRARASRHRLGRHHCGPPIKPCDRDLGSSFVSGARDDSTMSVVAPRSSSIAFSIIAPMGFSVEGNGAVPRRRRARSPVERASRRSRSSPRPARRRSGRPSTFSTTDKGRSASARRGGSMLTGVAAGLGELGA
jgi:hypothetical protein